MGFLFRNFGQNTKTLKLAKVGLAKVGQHIETLKLAKVGLGKVRQAHNWPKSVKALAQVGLAKVGHDRECGGRVDLLGRHRAACPRTGRLRSRAQGTERSLARVCREAGAIVRCNTKLRDMNVHVPAQDERAIEVLASGFPLHHGAQFAVDITLRSALGRACPNASQESGAVLTRAREDKEAKYHELLSSERCCLVVVALVAGGVAKRSSSSRHWLVPELGTVLRRCVDPLSTFGVEGGSGCCQCSLRGPMRPRWSLPGQRLLTGKTGLRPIWSSSFQVDLSGCSVLRQQRCERENVTRKKHLGLCPRHRCTVGDDTLVHVALQHVRRSARSQCVPRSAFEFPCDNL